MVYKYVTLNLTVSLPYKSDVVNCYIQSVAIRLWGRPCGRPVVQSGFIEYQMLQMLHLTW